MIISIFYKKGVCTLNKSEQGELGRPVDQQKEYELRAYLGDITGRRVLTLTDENIVQGDDGYIGIKLYEDDSKEESTKRLIWLPTNQVVARQEVYGESSFLDGRIVINHDIRQAVIDGTKSEFVPMEFSLLRFLAMNKGVPQSIKDIFEEVWGDSAYRSSATVRVHIARVRRKLGGLKWTVRTIKNWGYMFDDSFPNPSEM